VRGDFQAYSRYEMVKHDLDVIHGRQVLAHILDRCLHVDALTMRLHTRLVASSEEEVSARCPTPRFTRWD